MDEAKKQVQKYLAECRKLPWSLEWHDRIYGVEQIEEVVCCDVFFKTQHQKEKEIIRRVEYTAELCTDPLIGDIMTRRMDGMISILKIYNYYNDNGKNTLSEIL